MEFYFLTDSNCLCLLGILLILSCRLPKSVFSYHVFWRTNGSDRCCNINIPPLDYALAFFDGVHMINRFRRLLTMFCLTCNVHIHTVFNYLNVDNILCFKFNTTYPPKWNSRIFKQCLFLTAEPILAIGF